MLPREVGPTSTKDRGPCDIPSQGPRFPGESAVFFRYSASLSAGLAVAPDSESELPDSIRIP